MFKKTAVNSERVTHESYIKLISWVAQYIKRIRTRCSEKGRFVIVNYCISKIFSANSFCANHPRNKIKILFVRDPERT